MRLLRAIKTQIARYWFQPFFPVFGFSAFPAVGWRRAKTPLDGSAIVLGLERLPEGYATSRGVRKRCIVGTFPKPSRTRRTDFRV